LEFYLFNVIYFTLIPEKSFSHVLAGVAKSTFLPHVMKSCCSPLNSTALIYGTGVTTATDSLQPYLIYNTSNGALFFHTRGNYAELTVRSATLAG
jgi:hypothetical protein